MKKAILLSAALFMFGTGTANASGFSFNIYESTPVTAGMMQPLDAAYYPAAHHYKYCNDRCGHRYICGHKHRYCRHRHHI